MTAASPPRLTRLVAIFNIAGLSARTSTDISDYLARHAAFVAPLAHMLILHHCDNRAMARSTAGLEETYLKVIEETK